MKNTDDKKEAAPASNRRRPQNKPLTQNVVDMSEKVKDFDKPFDVLRWVTRTVDWPTREKMAYIALYLRRSENSQHPHPGIRLLAKDIGSTKDAARAAVSALVLVGAIAYTPRGGPKGQHLYTLHPPWEAKQIITRKQRGPLSRCPVLQDASLYTGQQVSCITGRALSLYTGQKEPIEGTKLRNQVNTPSPLAQSVLALPSDSSSSKSKTSDSSDTQTLVARLDSLLEDSGCEKIEDWGAARKMAGNVLKGSGGSPMPVQQAIEALEWGFSDSYQRSFLLSGGLKALRRVWAAWLEKDNPTTGRGWKKQRGAPSGDINSREDLGY